MARPATLLAIAVTAAFAAGPVRAWDAEGHVVASVAAVESLPHDVPAFFRDGVDAIAHAAIDPDIYRNPAAPQLRDADGPQHFLNLELLQGRDLPPLRSEFIALCHELGLAPGKVGYLPYAITEAMQRLTLAFAEHRAGPDDPHIRAKCLVLAGHLSHYAADLHMPLQTTIHFDGRADAEGRVPGTGIHRSVDRLLERLTHQQIFPNPIARPRVAEDAFALVIEHLRASHALVDRVYELDPLLPTDAQAAVDPQLVAFVRERMNAAAGLTASLILTAWRDARRIRFDEWISRPAIQSMIDRSKGSQSSCPK